MSEPKKDKKIFREVEPNRLTRARQLRQKMSLPEVLLWQRLRPKVISEFHFRRQAPLLNRYTVDFYFSRLKIVFEVDGAAHEASWEADVERDRRLKGAGISVVRISLLGASSRIRTELPN